MIEKFIKLQFELTAIFYAYTVGYLFLFIPYILSFGIPPIKKTIKNYEISGSRKAISLISFISGSILFLVFTIITPDLLMKPLEKIFLYIAFIIWGYFALFLMADYRKKKHFFFITRQLKRIARAFGFLNNRGDLNINQH